MNCSKLGANGLRCELTWIRNDRNPHEALACLLFCACENNNIIFYHGTLISKTIQLK